MSWYEPLITLITVCVMGTGGAGDCNGMIARVGPLEFPWSITEYRAGAGAFIRYREEQPLGFKVIGDSPPEG